MRSTRLPLRLLAGCVLASIVLSLSSGCEKAGRFAPPVKPAEKKDNP